MNSAVRLARSDDVLSPNLTLPPSLKEQIKLQKLDLVTIQEDCYHLVSHRLIPPEVHLDPWISWLGTKSGRRGWMNEVASTFPLLSMIPK